MKNCLASLQCRNYSSAEQIYNELIMFSSLWWWKSCMCTSTESNKWGYLHFYLNCMKIERMMWIKALWTQLELFRFSGQSWQLTSLRKELGVNGLKVLLIHHTTWTLLGHKCELRKLISSQLAQNILHKGLHGNFSSRQTDTALNSHNNGTGTRFFFRFICWFAVSPLCFIAHFQPHLHFWSPYRGLAAPSWWT